MKIISTFIITVFILLGNITHAQNTEDLKAINSQIWSNFTKAFEALDYELFGSLHNENLVRIGGDSKTIRGKSNYILGYRERWEKDSINQTISFRFLERICKNDKASERGIYKLTINPNSENEGSHYGKFHVILEKEKGVWEILVDYDSTENKTVNEDSYSNAFAPDDFDKF